MPPGRRDRKVTPSRRTRHIGKAMSSAPVHIHLHGAQSMPSKKFVVSALAALGLGTLPVTLLACGSSTPSEPSLVSADFTGMDAPATADQKADMYTTARVTFTYSDGTSKTHDLAYDKIFDTTDVVGGAVVGGLFDSGGAPLLETGGQMTFAAWPVTTGA